MERSSSSVSREAAEKAPESSLEVRRRLVRALNLDLIGPGVTDEFAEERLPGWVRPSNWYLTGFLIPNGTPAEGKADLDEDDEVEAVPEAAGLAEESTEDRKSAKKGFFPSSMGLSFLVPKEATKLGVIVNWGDYSRQEIADEEGRNLSVWQRSPRHEAVDLPLAGGNEPLIIPVPNSGGLQLFLLEREVASADLAGYIAPGTRSVSVFLANSRSPDEEDPDRRYAFQAAIQVRCDQQFVPRPDLKGSVAEDWDDQVADLQYADAPEYATGHGTSVDWEVAEGECRLIRTTWVPVASVEKTATVDDPSVELSMEVLGALPDGKAAEEALRPIVDGYRSWIATQRNEASTLSGARRDTAEQLLHFAEVAARRIEQGIARLIDDEETLDAFRVANRTVARALRQRLRIDSPRWRTFQLAFILLNLPGLADPAEPSRDIVDLLFFPTGGGKTEAYLGLAAFTMVLRRLRRPGTKGLEGAGVSVIMRYTLRLLTLDQLSRAAGLVCALELEREANTTRYGSWPFEVGLWVGKAAAPNILGRKGDGRSDSARSKTIQFKKDPKWKPAPIPLEECPWCQTRFGSDSFALLPNDDFPTELRIVCLNIECEFTRGRPLPIVAVDDSIYRRLPAFLVATIDKFASLPWVGQTGALLGHVDHYDSHGFYGPSDPGKAARLEAPMGPPDLIIQDELHLISGPLGTMTGLYETAIEALCQRGVDGKQVKPKIVASTATVRRAQTQIQGLFARPLTQIFPPPGPDRRDSFFARTLPISEAPARLYLGIAAQGRNPKVVMRRVWLALMGAAERAYRDAGGHGNSQNPADPYMTVLGYFNSLRELGGARRIVEEEVQNTIKGYGARKRIGEQPGLFQDRRTFSEVVELTSRVSTDKVAEARRRLGHPFHEAQRVDCALATNMISVGLDIPRLGLMVVFGQPKSHAEYIQATSRVGRDDRWPGLVVALLNIHKPRDRSHYERFRHYHETFYRSVEAGSVTPFSARALDRGFAGALVGLARHSLADLEPPKGVEKLASVRAALEKQLVTIFSERIRHQPFLEEAEREERLRSVQNLLVDLLDSWQKIFSDYQATGVRLQYANEVNGPKPLLRDILDTDFESPDHRKFRANRSLRDVEPNVNLFLKELNGLEVGEQS
jgi:hypothetical protein